MNNRDPQEREFSARLAVGRRVEAQTRQMGEMAAGGVAMQNLEQEELHGGGVSANLLYGFGHIIVQNHNLPPSRLTMTPWPRWGLLPFCYPECLPDDGR
jgi:hypothetical protein